MRKQSIRSDIEYNGYAHAFAGMGTVHPFMGLDVGVRMLLLRRVAMAAPFARLRSHARMLLGSRAAVPR